MSDNSPTNPLIPTILSGLAAIAYFFGTVATLILSWFLRRPQQNQEIHQSVASVLESSARSRKLAAETRQIDAGIISDAYDRMEDMEKIIHDQSLVILENTRAIAILKWDLETANALTKSQEQSIKEAHAELMMLRHSRLLLPGDRSQNSLS